MPEGRRLFTKMNVLENLEMGAFTPKAWNQRKITMKQVFDLFPRLNERKKQISGTLSGGEQQMLAIGIGLMAKPKLLIIDELSLGLAPILISAVYNSLLKIQDMGTTLLIAEQNIHHILKICDRAYLLETGTISLEGKAEELLNNNYLKKAYLGIA